MTYDFNSLNRYVVDSSRDHWEALKGALKNLKGTKNLKILVKEHKQLGGDFLKGYID